MWSKRLVLVCGGLLLCVLPGCGGVNTAIGSPAAYWHHGFLALVGFLVVCFLILMATAGLAFTFHPTETDQANVMVAVVMLVGAALVLQLLPQTASGIRFLPTLPWQHSGRLATAASVTSWICLAIAYFCAKSPLQGDWKTAAGAIALALTLNALLPLESKADSAKQTAAEPASDDEIVQWEELKHDRTTTLEEFLSDRRLLVTRIQSLGFKTKHELMTNNVGRALVEELEQLSRQIARLQDEIHDIDSALERSQSAQRRADRQDKLRRLEPPSPEKYEKLSQMNRETGERPPDFEVLVDRLLDEILKSPTPNHGKGRGANE